MKELIRNREGALSTLVLVLLPLLIIALIGVTETARNTYTSVDLQQAVDSAVRAGAMCVDNEAQANMDIRIDPDRADTAFRKELAANLGLDETTLKPELNSGVAETPRYQLVIINGTNPYVPEGQVVTADGGYSVVEVDTGELPVACGISDTGISVGGAGDRQVTLESPGCMAVVIVKMKAVMTPNYDIIRWSTARIKTV
ncbi:pilus assembly protein TadG-related protein [Pelotomaculum propionicicum]|uniref:pilus assembly protein TadG-related protein n=1 Tax=Pelotomaculum propionicicum TaxID=258475 RepID=UPI003B7A6467